MSATKSGVYGTRWLASEQERGGERGGGILLKFPTTNRSETVQACVCSLCEFIPSVSSSPPVGPSVFVPQLGGIQQQYEVYVYVHAT